MCLVEVEGTPKLQAGCTLTAQDGMVVRTARTSQQAAEGQNATLEFILVNHPLDCPVCDKGGECPLQDLTFRYGPGNTRMTFPSRTVALTLHPTGQSPQTVGTSTISHGRPSKRYCVGSSAPTGHSSVTLPVNAPV